MAKRFSESRTTWPIKKYGEDGDCYMIQPKRGAEKGKPRVLDRRKQDILEDNIVYGGCWVNASVDVFCYTQNGGGVTTYIRGVQFIREDAPLSGAAANCEADFEDLGDDGSQEQAQDDGGRSAVLSRVRALEPASGVPEKGRRACSFPFLPSRTALSFLGYPIAS